jgi:hypothetical protein
VNIRNDPLRDRLKRFLLDGKTPKEFALKNHVSQSWAYRLTWELGFRSIYVSDDEQKQLRKART